jgi:hypothetical protein
MAHVFIAGVMQGSRLDDRIDGQDYRLRISEALQRHLPDTDVTDPWMLHPNSVAYGDAETRQTFMDNTDLARQADVLIAYLPHASMGTAIELWEAHHNGTYIIAVTPMVHNWVVRITADEILPDLDSLLAYIESGRLARILQRSSPPLSPAG